MPALPPSEDDDPLVRLSLDRQKRSSYWAIHAALLERDSAAQMDAVQAEASQLERLKVAASNGDRFEKADVYEASYTVRRLAAIAGLSASDLVDEALAKKFRVTPARYPEFDPFGLRGLLHWRPVPDDSLPEMEFDAFMDFGARGDAPGITQIVTRWAREQTPQLQRCLSSALREVIDQIDEHSPAFEPLVRLHFRWMVSLLEQLGLEIAHAHCRLLQKVRGARDGFLVHFVDRAELGRMVQRHWAAAQSDLVDYYKQAMDCDHTRWMRDFEAEAHEPLFPAKQIVTFVPPTRVSRFPFLARIVGFKP